MWHWQLVVFISLSFLCDRYTNNGVLKDAVVIHTDPAATPFLEVSEEQRPYGFREWRKVRLNKIPSFAFPCNALP
jgi:hypothetical protein